VLALTRDARRAGWVPSDRPGTPKSCRAVMRSASAFATPADEREGEGKGRGGGKRLSSYRTYSSRPVLSVSRERGGVSERTTGKRSEGFSKDA